MSRAHHKLVGEGKSGCVFDPPLPCVRGTTSASGEGIVGKVVARDRAGREVKKSAEIRKVDHDGAFSSRYLGVCEVDVDRSRAALETCGIQAIRGAGKGGLTQLMFDDAGESFKAWDKRSASSASPSASASACTPEILQVISASVTLFDGLARLAAHGLCHCDVHDGNVAVDAARRMRLIDFGRVTRLGDIFKWNGKPATYRWFNAPEQMLLMTPAMPWDERIAAIEYELRDRTPYLLGPLQHDQLVALAAELERRGGRHPPPSGGGRRGKEHRGHRHGHRGADAIAIAIADPAYASLAGKQDSYRLGMLLKNLLARRCAADDGTVPPIIPATLGVITDMNAFTRPDAAEAARLWRAACSSLLPTPPRASVSTTPR